ncbi:MAG: glycosyltransferase [Acidobacteria bacterium]|nr:glycosyltransferase [Acidobacteriota bacterium]
MDVRVFTTCARDYLTWRNAFPPGTEEINGVPVERFRVDRERELEAFGHAARRVFGRAHTLQEEIDWLWKQGPVSLGLIARLRRIRRQFDFALLFSLRYFQTYYGARAVADRAILVPTAEREAAVALRIFQPVLRGVRGIMYNSLEERAMIHRLAGNEQVPGVVVGVGSRIPAAADPARARQKFGLAAPFLVYVGRIDPNKGCAELFDYFVRYSDTSTERLELVSIGTAAMPLPAHPRIRHLGYVSDDDKFDVMAASAAVVVPSYYESLSMAALEAWALGRPVLANAACDVLVGQCLRSNAGLYYGDALEFAAVVDCLAGEPCLADALARNGRAYYAQHYRWPVIERKYLDMFDRLSAERAPRRIERLPGWFARRRPDIPAADELLARVPAGPAPDDELREDEVEPPRAGQDHTR